MPTIELSYGHKRVQVSLSEARVLGVLVPLRAGQPPNEAAVVRDALDQPICSPRLRDLARPGQRVAVITSDLTRPCPSAVTS